ncbi:TatD family hydrolase [Candidatus Dependentiae bacterium]|nr:TatD family hydrolase [Candidatus Dependentiae bacterium]
MFIDTHCHINMMVKKEFDVLLAPHQIEQAVDVIKRSQAAGIQAFINVGTSVPESLNSVALAKHYTAVYATVGLHPCDCTPEWRKDFEQIKKLAQHKEENKIVAIGEIGLDFYHKPFDMQRQKDAFKAQIELALEYKLPLSVHVRDAGEETLRVLEEYAREIRGAVIHCFSQNKDFANVVLEWGFYVGIDAPIGYPKNQQLRDVAAAIPLERIILETDSPFLPPQEFRGRPNSPEYLPLFVPVIAELKGVSAQEVGRVTTDNACKLFGIELT